MRITHGFCDTSPYPQRIIICEFKKWNVDFTQMFGNKDYLQIWYKSYREPVGLRMKEAVVSIRFCFFGWKLF